MLITEIYSKLFYLYNLQFFNTCFLIIIVFLSHKWAPYLVVGPTKLGNINGCVRS